MGKPVQATCAWTFHRSHSAPKIYRQNGRGAFRRHRFVSACAIETHMGQSARAFVWKFGGKTAGDSKDIVLCEPASVEMHMNIFFTETVASISQLMSCLVSSV